MSKTISALRKKHPQFVYENFTIEKLNNNLKIAYKFKIEPDIYFNPEITIGNINQAKIDSLDNRTINNLAFHLGLMEIPSYWKATCSPQILIKAGHLNLAQLNWWHKLLIKGMGQFYYTNKIDFRKRDFLKIKVDSKKKFSPSNQKFNPNQILVPIGGGKDSLVTLEILQQAGYKTIPFLLNPVHNPIKSAENIIQAIGSKEAIICQHRIDPKLFDLNRAGYLNGHIPIVAFISFASLLAAILSDSDAVAISNERSADEGNLTYLGHQINHQYDKTWQFEKEFVFYLRKYLIPKLKFFSFLKPLYELQIAKLFSRYPQYFPLFRSCNRGQKTNSWCGQCPKCLFIFTILYPFLPTKKLLSIFGQNLFEKRNLWPLAKNLTGVKGTKPFECVGTYQETRVALFLALKKAKKENKTIPLILKLFEREILPQFPNLETESTTLLSSFSRENLLGPELNQLLKTSLKQ